MYSFILMLDRLFYESQMMVYIFFQDTNWLRNLPDCQGIVFKFIDDLLPYGLLSFIYHSICPGTILQTAIIFAHRYFFGHPISTVLLKVVQVSYQTLMLPYPLTSADWMALSFRVTLSSVDMEITFGAAGYGSKKMIRLGKAGTGRESGQLKVKFGNQYQARCDLDAIQGTYMI